MSAAFEAALRNVRDTLAIAMEHTNDHAAVVVADERTDLARLLFRTYRECLPNARLVSFDEVTHDAVKASFADLKERDLVVLIQSAAFKIPEFRIRVELFRRGIKVIEHMNLDRMVGPDIDLYVAALAYDPAYYRGVGHALKARMDVAKSARIESEGEVLTFDSPLEETKLNIGHFAGLKNIGSMFPIGEVFTESRDLEKVNGRAKIYGFTDTTFRLNVPANPITMIIEKGRVVGADNSTTEFDKVLAVIRADEGEVWLRELGFGMNKAFSRDRHVPDVGAFERVCGVHLSLGGRHGVYKKPHLNHREVRYHVDSFVVTSRVLLDDDVVYDDGEWKV
jgi:leucyl aminopeptidase (aminopeptidase T)